MPVRATLMRRIDRSSSGSSGDSCRAGNDQVLCVTERNVEDVSGRHGEVWSLPFLYFSKRDLQFTVIDLANQACMAQFGGPRRPTGNRKRFEEGHFRLVIAHRVTTRAVHIAKDVDNSCLCNDNCISRIDQDLVFDGLLRIIVDVVMDRMALISASFYKNVSIRSITQTTAKGDNVKNWTRSCNRICTWSSEFSNESDLLSCVLIDYYGNLRMVEKVRAHVFIMDRDCCLRGGHVYDPHATDALDGYITCIRYAGGLLEFRHVQY